MSTSRFVILFLLLAMFSSIASASPGKGGHHNNNRYKNHNHHPATYARVIFVKPIYKTVRLSRPQTRCVTHIPHQAGNAVVQNQSPDRLVMGGILGGLVGHELGNDRNRAFTTMAGIVIGSAIANDMANTNYRSNNYRPDHHQVCRQQTRFIEQQKIVGYKVKYRYRGQIFVTQTRHHPGQKISVPKELRNHRHDM